MRGPNEAHEVDAAHVRRVADQCASFLDDHLDDDWSLQAPDLEMSVVEVVAHAAEVCLWYALDLAAGGDDLEPVEQRVRTDGDRAAVVDTLRAHAAVAAAVIEMAPADARGFHPMGSADASGFAAMACDEMLIHTDDAARGVGATFVPSADLAEPVLRRLFPWVGDGDDPWAMLKWANGRIALADRPRQQNWAWHCAPLSEWDGTMAVRPRPDS